MPDLVSASPPVPLYLFSVFPFQTCRERLEGQQASSGREIQWRQSEAQARSSTGGGHRCHGCLRKAVEVKELTESLELVKVMSGAAVDRCNALAVDLERGREDSRQLESSLEEAKSEFLRVQVRERGHIYALIIQKYLCNCFCVVFVSNSLEQFFCCGLRGQTFPCTTRHKASSVVLTVSATKNANIFLRIPPTGPRLYSTVAGSDDRASKRYTLHEYRLKSPNPSSFVICFGRQR